MASIIARQGRRISAVGALLLGGCIVGGVLGGCAGPQLAQMAQPNPAAKKVTDCLTREAAVAAGPQTDAAAAAVLARCQPDLLAEQTSFKSSHTGPPEAAEKDAVKLSAYRAEQAKDFVVLAKLAPVPSKGSAAPAGAAVPASTAPLAKPKRELPVADVYRIAQKSVYLVIAGATPDAVKRGDASLGSAVAVAPNLALTNCHIIARRPLLAVVDADTKAVMKAHVTKAHPQSDRCILKVEGALNPIAKIGKLQDVRVGERVYTIGNPSGMSRTLGEGLVSGLRKAADGVQVIQTTAQISKGSSGGALLDSEGALIGITTFTLRDAQNMNFAIAAEEYFK